MIVSKQANSVATLINALQLTIETHQDEVAELDRAIGDGDHVINLERGLNAIEAISDELSNLEWSAAFMKIGMTLMSTMGGASGSLFGTLFISMAKAAKDKQVDLVTFSAIFAQGIDSVKLRGKSDIGEKTMLDTLIPVANSLLADVRNNIEFKQALENTKHNAVSGMQSTKALLATKGRASFLGERAIGHIDPGARTSQLMICAIADELLLKD
ncbi:dihydroxyacetone kinase subunit DhaL [Pseudomonadota bacterium]|nr:dihydroxyacetone kinase subunit DhaL [Pseudomonadota bacterium]